MTRVDLSEAERDQWERASQLIDDGEYSRAEIILDELLAQDRDEPRLYAHRGYTRYRLGKYEDAVEDFSAALLLKPNAKNTLFLRGRCLEELESFREAICDYDRVIALSPETADAYAHKGFCLEQLGELNDARSAYERALQLNPSETLALAGLKELNR